MMPYTVSGFIVGNDNYAVPVGYTMVILHLNTWNRQNLTGTFTISATGYSEDVQADASGRAIKVVPAGTTYTVHLTHAGTYLNDEDQTFVAASEEIVWVDYFLDHPAGTHTATVTVPAEGGSVTVTGMTADALIWVSPVPASHDAYVAAGCRCVSQSTDTLVFEVTRTAEDDLDVNVAWQYVE